MCLYKIITKYFQDKNLEKCTSETAKQLSFNGQEKVCKVLSVYDGDTCTLAFYHDESNQIYQWKCRLYGINAPEIRSLDANEKLKGFVSRDHLKKRIEGKLVLAQINNF